MSHLEVKLTSTHGAGLGMFFAHGHLATSTAYLRGESPETESEVLSTWVASLRRSLLVRHFQATHPFQDIFTLHQRPLHTVIVWANPSINDEDYALVTELSDHFAAAFLCRPQDPHAA